MENDKPQFDGRTREGRAARAAADNRSHGSLEDAMTASQKRAEAHVKPHEETSFTKPVEDAMMSSQARAEARIRAIRSNPDLANGVDRDKYWAPPPPDGWDYQWKLKSVLNQDDIDRIRQNEMNGWEPVPLSRHPELMPRNWKGETIEVGGLVLMERPMMFTQEAREEERRAAREAVWTKENQMREGKAGDLGPRNVNRFSKSHSRIDVPTE